MEAIYMGASQSRNPNLAAVFYRIGLVESYGTGIRKILHLYRGADPAPVFKSAEGAFMVTLPIRNTGPENDGTEKSIRKKKTLTSWEKEKESVLELAVKRESITRKEVEEAFGYGSTKAYKLLMSLCEERKLVQQKSGNHTVYVPDM